jgi:V-type H+-transporting ATPase subunit d
MYVMSSRNVELQPRSAQLSSLSCELTFILIMSVSDSKSQQLSIDSSEAKRDVLESNLWWVRHSNELGGLASFNVDYGYIEAIVRGFRSGFIKSFEYRQLSQCETLDDVKLSLGDTDYLNVLQNVNKLTPDLILRKCEDKFVQEFLFVQSQATGELSSFLEFVTYEDLITNISFIITSMIKGADPAILLSKCLPLGRSPHLRAVMTFDNLEGSDALVELYRTVLIDTPVAPYFENYFNQELKSDQPSREIQRVYNETEIDIITNMLQKLWLEDFYNYCQKLGGETCENNHTTNLTRDMSLTHPY